MAEQTNAWNERTCEKDKYERCCPSWDLVRSDTEVRVRFMRLHGFGGKQQEHPYTNMILALVSFFMAGSIPRAHYYSIPSQNKLLQQSVDSAR
jgi:hypothetical protein